MAPNVTVPELITWFTHGHGLLRAQKDLRRHVLRRPFGTGVTADAHPLLSLSSPKPALLGRNGLTHAVHKFETQRRFRWRLDIEGAVGLHRRLAQYPRIATAILGPDSHFRHGVFRNPLRF